MRTNDELLDTLKEFYNKNGRSPRKRDIPGNTTICARFGSWNEALVSAGIPVNKRFHVSENELLDELISFHDKHGRSPSAKDTNEHEELRDMNTYCRGLNCSTWNEVLRKAGLPLNNEISEYSSLDNERLIAVLKQEIKKRGIRDRNGYISRGKDLPSLHTLITRFGNMKKVAEILDLNLRTRQYSDDELREEIRMVEEIVGHVPSSVEFDKYSSVDSKTIRNRGRWNNTLKRLGFTPVHHVSVPNDFTDEQLIEKYKTFSEEIGNVNGASTRELNHSSVKPDVYIYRFGSINNLRVLAGFKPVERGRRRYTKNEIIELLKMEIEKKNGRITYNDIKNNPNLPSLSTILRYLGVALLNQIVGEQ